MFIESYFALMLHITPDTPTVFFFREPFIEECNGAKQTKKKQVWNNLRTIDIFVQFRFSDQHQSVVGLAHDVTEDDDHHLFI